MLFSGDVVYVDRLLGVLPMGRTKAWLDTFAAIEALNPERVVPGHGRVCSLDQARLAMALFFTAAAVGPLVTPWERQARIYEWLVKSPASLGAILAADAGAGAAFGKRLALLPLAGSLALTSAAIVDPIALAAGWVLGALAFATVGVLLAAPATDTPSQVMMLSNQWLTGLSG